MSRCGTRFVDGSTCGDKPEHVRREMRRGPTANHHCHWPGGCEAITAAAQFCCTKHWRMIPRRLQQKVWATYRIGQETSKTPTREYMVVMKEIKDWWIDKQLEGL